jgi:pimeloyl-ACP methyl ester carboxylesterase
VSELPRSRIEANGLSFSVVDAGEGPAVLLLHGFPDSSELWRHQVPALVDAGYRVIAPDLRGFGDSDRPEGADQYVLPLLLLDVVSILDGLGEPRVSVVGHDWGAALSWGMAALVPDRVERLVALSVGHPSAYFALGGLEQLERSWYMLFFQFEGVAEDGLRADDWALFRRWTHGGDTARHLADLSRPGALTAGLNWYRANIAPAGFASPGPPLPPVTCPVLAVWSDGDHHCLEPQMVASGRFVDSHWIPLDAPDRLNELLLGFLRDPAPT